MNFINQFSYYEVPRNLSRYIEVLSKYWWQYTGGIQYYEFSTFLNGNSGLYNIKELATGEKLWFLPFEYSLSYNEISDQFILYFKHREWKIYSLKAETNYGTAILELEGARSFLIQLKGMDKTRYKPTAFNSSNIFLNT